MTHLLDSDVTIDYLNGQLGAGHALRSIGRQNLSISAVSIAELLDGIINSPERAARELGLRRLLGNVRIRIINRAIGERAGQVRADLRRRKQPVDKRALDLFVAATALELGLIVVTRNLKDYDDIPGLELYSWPKDEL